MRSRDTEGMTFHALVLLCVNQHTKFEVPVPSFTNSKYMIGAKFYPRQKYLWVPQNLKWVS